MGPCLGKGFETFTKFFKTRYFEILMSVSSNITLNCQKDI